MTIEYITFLDGSRVRLRLNFKLWKANKFKNLKINKIKNLFNSIKTLFWAIDLKFGYSDIIACMKFCDGVDNMSSNLYPNNNESEYSLGLSKDKNFERRGTLNLELKNQISNPDLASRRLRSFSLGKSDSNFSNNLRMYLESQRKFRFILPILTHPEIANVKMRDLVQKFRNELIVYDLEKNNGILLNLPDIIQCGMFGICGITRSRADLMKILEKSINLVKDIVTKKEEKSISFSFEKRTDIISVFDIIGRIKYFVKNDKWDEGFYNWN